MTKKIKNTLTNQTSPKARGQRLRWLRKAMNLNAEDIEKKFQVKANTQQSWEKGNQTGLSVQGAKRMVMVYRSLGVPVTIGWLLNGVGEPPSIPAPKDFYIDTQAQQKRGLKASSNSFGATIAVELNAFRQNNEDAISTKINDDGMEPYYMENDFVAGNRRYDDRIASLIGYNCIVELPSGEILVRQIRKGSKPGFYTLICINAQTKTAELIIQDTEILSAAPIIWHRKKDIK